MPNNALPITASESFNRAASSYDQFANFQLNIATNLCKLIKDNKTILDIGSGTGYIAKLTNCRAIQVDLAFNMCQVSQTQSSSVVNANMEQLPFLDSCVDTVTSSLSLHWACNIRKSIQEAHRVLQNNGRIFISIPIQNTFCELNHVLISLGIKATEFLKLRYILSLMEQTGFTIDDTTHTSILKERHNTFEEFIRSMKNVGANFNKNQTIINKRTFYLISELYHDMFSINGGIEASWYIAYIIATKS